MKKKHRTGWRRTLSLLPPLTILCGLIATLYFFYRAALFTVPAVTFEQQLFQHKRSPVAVCGNEEVASMRNASPLLSARYQHRIKEQKEAPNLVTNPDFFTIDPQTDGPVGYTQSADTPTSKFEFQKEQGDEKPFLRITNTQPVQPTPIWAIDAITITAERTYAYGFSYRSTTPIEVSLETIKDGKSSYQSITTLPAKNSWTEFWAHFNNSASANTFRVLVSPLGGVGQVDTRQFNVHQIPSAKLKSGNISVTFDDGWQSIKTGALALLQQYDIRTTQYIISEVSESEVAGYMSFDTIAALKQTGHEIGSHSLLHCNQAALSKEMAKDNAKRSKEILENHKLGPIKSFAYPFGEYNEATQSIYSKEYPLIRTADFGYNDRYFDETNLRSIGIKSSTTDAELRSWVEYAKVHKLWLIVVYHRINENGEYSVSTAQLDRQLKIIKESGLKILPVSEAAVFAREK